tara:strand:+ start:2381 stop:2575 length:195 start_codon:yes stop_codon:yes gene_type:complete
MIRVMLLKSWKHPYKAKPYAVGSILQCAPYLAMELLADKIGKLYDGEYPPKEKVKIELSTLTTK